MSVEQYEDIKTESFECVNDLNTCISLVEQNMGVVLKIDTLVVDNVLARGSHIIYMGLNEYKIAQ